MDHTVENYRQLIQAYLSEYVSTPIANGENQRLRRKRTEYEQPLFLALLTPQGAGNLPLMRIESYTVFDMQQDHYQAMNVGWDGYRRVYGCVLHLDIRDGKIWLQQNTTERQVAHDLMAMGVPSQDIVLGFQAPGVRSHTGFGVA